MSLIAKRVGADGCIYWPPTFLYVFMITQGVPVRQDEQTFQRERWSIHVSLPLYGVLAKTLVYYGGLHEFADNECAR